METVQETKEADISLSDAQDAVNSCHIEFEKQFLNAWNAYLNYRTSLQTWREINYKQN